MFGSTKLGPSWRALSQRGARLATVVAVAVLPVEPVIVDRDAISSALAAAPDVDLKSAGHAIRGDMDDTGLVDVRTIFGDPRVSTVVVGTISDLVPGQALGEVKNDEHPVPTTILVIDVVQALKGQMGSAGKVYVQLFGTFDRGSTLRAIPIKSVVVVYGTTVGPESFVQDPSRGKPSDAPFVRVGTVGLSVLRPAGGAVSPVRGDVHPTWTIADLIPAKVLARTK
jgi:hypothetical protein